MVVILDEPLRSWNGGKVLIYGPSYVSDNVEIGAGTKIGAFSDISRDTCIGAECNIQAHATISVGTWIGDNVFIAPKVTVLNDLYPVSHHLSPVRILSGAVIGGGVVLNPGVTVGERAVVCSGSLVTRDVPEEVVVKGSPARIHCSLMDYNEKKRRYINEEE